MKKAELEKLAVVLNLIGYEIERIGPRMSEHVSAGCVNRTEAEGYTLSIIPIRDNT